MDPPRDEQTSFVWPPRPVVDGPTADTPPGPPDATFAVTPAASATRARLGAWWREIEDHWLVPTALPLSRRIEITGWRADASGDYCDRCGSTIGPHEADEFGCADCRGTRPAWSRFTRLGAYEGLLGEWVREVKFQRNRWLGESLGAELGRALRRGGLQGREILVAPVPTSRRRRLSRGIDHTLALARGVARELDGGVARLLHRSHRPSQLSVAVSERAGNVSGSIRPKSRKIASGGGVTGRTVVLVDDVTTTGATLRAAARALVRGGIGAGAIWVGVLAVTPDTDRRVGPGPSEAGGEGVDNAAG